MVLGEESDAELEDTSAIGKGRAELEVGGAGDDRAEVDGDSGESGVDERERVLGVGPRNIGLGSGEST